MSPQPPDAHRPESTPGHARGAAPGQFPRWIWVVYLVLFAASVPWYVPADAPLRIWFGLPHWVVMSLAATFGVAVFTAFVVHFLWPTQETPDA
jgi:hypothetical protein